MKRLETFLTSPGHADPARQPLGRTVCWLENPRPAPFPLQQSSTRPGHLKSRCQPKQFVKFCLEMASMVESETSTEQKTINKSCGFCQGPQPAKRMDAGKVAEGEFLRLIFCWITAQSPQILQETYCLPRKQSSLLAENHGLGLHPVWGCARDLQGGRQHQ